MAGRSARCRRRLPVPEADAVGAARFGSAGVGGGGSVAYAMAKAPRFHGFAGVAGYYADAGMSKRSMGERVDASLTRALKAQVINDVTGRAEMIVDFFAPLAKVRCRVLPHPTNGSGRPVPARATACDSTFYLRPPADPPIRRCA